ncbi:hypothetical protein HYX19_04970 [Candidatus Woesearchaeota archaeon]|nr:hypothetical protein [Candidatus Woesearchaeota archaeon]
MNKIELGIEIEGKKLFDLLKNSEYMKQAGYEILYAQEYTKDLKVKEKVDESATIEKSVKGPIDGYGICYCYENNQNPKGDKHRYVHLRTSNTTPSRFSYFITLGDKDKILKDLEMLVKETKQNVLKLEETQKVE